MARPSRPLILVGDPGGPGRAPRGQRARGAREPPPRSAGPITSLCV